MLWPCQEICRAKKMHPAAHRLPTCQMSSPQWASVARHRLEAMHGTRGYVAASHTVAALAARTHQLAMNAWQTIYENISVKSFITSTSKACVTNTKLICNVLISPSQKKLELEIFITKINHTHTHNRFTALWNLSGKTRVSRYQKNIHPLLSS